MTTEKNVCVRCVHWTRLPNGSNLGACRSPMTTKTAETLAWQVCPPPRIFTPSPEGRR